MNNDKGQGMSNLDGSEYEGSRQQQSNEELEVNAPGGFKIRARGYDVIVLLAVAGLTLLGYITWQHTIDEKASKTEIVTTIKQMAESQEELAYIVSLTAAEREKLRLDMPSSLRKRLRDR